MIQFKDFEDRLANSWTVLHDKFWNLRPYLQFAADAVLYLILETVQKLNKEKKDHDCDKNKCSLPLH